MATIPNLAPSSDKALSTAMSGNVDDVLSRAGKAKTIEDIEAANLDISRGIVKGAEDIGKAEVEVAKQKPVLESKYREAQREAIRPAEEKYRATMEETEAAMQGFKPTKQTVTDLAVMSSLIGMIGQLLGRTGGQQSAVGAINSMAGMMEGYQKGQAELFRREQIEFDKNLKALQAKQERAEKSFQHALSMMPYNTAKAREEFEVALAELNSPIVTAKARQSGYVEAQKLLQENGKNVRALMQLSNKTGLGGTALPKDKDTMNQYRARYEVIKNIDDLQSLLNDPKYARLINPATNLTPDIIQNLQKNFPELSAKLARIQSQEFLIGGKALTQSEQKILAPIYNWRGLTVSALRERLAEGKRATELTNRLVEEDYPGLKTRREQYDRVYNEFGNLKSAPTTTGQDVQSEAIKRFGSYDPDQYEYGFDEKGFYRDKK